MNLSDYQCPNCHASDWRVCTAHWQCAACGRKYNCTDGVPRLYIEEKVGKVDITLRDYFYNGLLGRYYGRIMPFLTLPVRPGYRSGWIVYWIISAALLALAGYVIVAGVELAEGDRALAMVDAVALALLAAAVVFFMRHPYLFYLFVLAVPVKLALRTSRFRPRAIFANLHAGLIDEFKRRGGPLRVLDVSTGTCNSLYRHGWMELDAEYTGIDLSETMLLQGRDFMIGKGVAMDFVLGDAMQLPFRAETFDVVLNYGALNGYSDPGRALAEMARVARSGGIVLVLDEQLYEEASAVERLYFRRVLSSHDAYDRCPIQLLPPELAEVEVHQVYHFYYLLVGRKP